MRSVPSVRAVAPSAPTAVTTVAGRFQLAESLGTGGVATVHRAFDPATGRWVALKQLRASLTGDRRLALASMFEREYHTLVRFSHPRIVRAYDFGTTAEGPYYTMELLDAQELRELTPLPVRETCQHLRDVASALALIHSHRLIHRDVSPRNVRLASDQRAKLIDFGALTSFGASYETIGTAPCMAPEVLQRMPLDQRTDLFSLGAVGYYLLTGEHAYPARDHHDLPRIWKVAPASASQRKPHIPAALDALIMSLISLDPAQRPANAAWVIDRLTAIGQLEPEESDPAAESYLGSSRMVGRGSELQWLAKRVVRAEAGQGSTLLVEGAAGVGKTRLLHELGLAAQLRHAVLAKADAQRGGAPFSVLSELLLHLLSSAPELGKRATGPYAPLLGHASETLRQMLGSPELAVLPPDAMERRARFQAAFYGAFSDVAKERVLFLAIDNVQAADENSAACLAALAKSARHTRLVLLATYRDGEEVVAPGPVNVLRDRNSRLTLSNLSEASCAELVASLFGDVSNAGRLSHLLYERSAGNPQQCIDLARWLMKRGVIRYVGGTWVLPLDVASDELPASGQAVFEARLSALSSSARAVAELLSIHAQAVTVPDALAFAADSGLPATRLHGALDELLDDELLHLQDGRYRFAQEAMRRTVLAKMSDLRRCELHRAVADALIKRRSATVAQRIEAAWHLLRAGDETRGADLIADLANAFLKDNVGQESHQQVVEALIAAQTVYDREGRSEYDQARVLFPLMALGFFVDWRVTAAYGERAVQIGLRITGLARAAKLRSYVGRPVALSLALTGATFAHASGSGKSGAARFDLKTVIADFCAIVPTCVASWVASYDIDSAARMMDALSPLQLFGPDHVTTLMYDYGLAQVRMIQGRELEARDLLERALARFDTPAIKGILGDIQWRALKGGVLFCLGILSVLEFQNRAPEYARGMDALGIELWSLGADQARLLHHASRGEISLAKHYFERVERFAIQGGSMWQVELYLPYLLLPAYYETADVIGVRRCFEQLDRRTKQAPKMRLYARVAEAAYLALRGDTQAAVARFSEIVPQMKPHYSVAWVLVRGWFAMALIANDEPARARELVVETLGLLGPENPKIDRVHVSMQRVLALAEAGLGNFARACELLDGPLQKYAGYDQPLFLGHQHRARAEVALLMNDTAAFMLHARETERQFRATQNPTLLSLWERLMDRAARAGVSRRPEKRELTLKPEPPGDFDSAMIGLSQLTASGERHMYMLRLLMHNAGASSGYLFALEQDGMQLTASSSGGLPAPGLLVLLRQRVADAHVEAARERADVDVEAHQTVLERGRRRVRSKPREPRTDGHTGTTAASAHDAELRTVAAIERPNANDNADTAQPVTRQDGQRIVLLSAQRGGNEELVGGAILVFEGAPADPDSELVEMVAMAMYEDRAAETASNAITEHQLALPRTVRPESHD